MKKIKVLTITALAFALITSGNTALANTSSTYDTNAKIKFVPNEDVTPPVDPEDPNPETPVEPVDPTDSEGPGPNPGTPGPLSIDYASSFEFGEHKITSTTETYYAAPQTFRNSDKISPLYVQVTDNRGTESGWTLSVVQNGQFATADNEVLNGAEITVNHAAVKSIAASSKPSHAQESFTLTPEAKSTPLQASKGEGAGTYTYHFGTSETADSSVSLEVPGATTKYAKNYSTTLTWTLSDTPGNEDIDRK
ncbi:WxL domain-containing protein [Bacillus sp. C1-1]|nr:WxL domain-containing protein [Bacillus sp. C1-1]